MLQVQSRARTFGLETPGNCSVKCARSEAVAQETLRLDSDNLTRLLAPFSHVEREAMAHFGLDIARRPPLRRPERIGEQACQTFAGGWSMNRDK